MKEKKKFTPTSIQLDPEVVAVRKAAQEERMNRTFDEVVAERKKMREEDHRRIYKQVWKEKKTEIIFGYVGLLAVFIGIPLLFSMFM